MRKNRRPYSAKMKFQAVMEVLSGTKSPAQIAKTYGIHPNSLAMWKKTLLARGAEIFEQEGRDESGRRIAELEQLIGKKEVEIALLKNFLGRND